jgi:2-oxo-3-hexenedioate decarboxylase
MANIAALAKTVDDAARNARAIAQLSQKTAITADEGYDVQAASFARRLARGERQVGVKMGFTSRAKMVQMGVSDMIWGRLSDAMLVEDGGEIDLADYVHPRVEPEIAFLLGASLHGPITAVEALAAVEAVAPAMEIIDSRYRKFKFSLADVVADNCSSSGFVVGAWQNPDADLSNLGMVMEFNGRPVQIGSSGAILGHPVRALAAAARLSTEPLEAGWIVMAGGATAAEAIRPAIHVRNMVQELGAVAFSVAG